jgi:hypothetical protein
MVSVNSQIFPLRQTMEDHKLLSCFQWLVDLQVPYQNLTYPKTIINLSACLSARSTVHVLYIFHGQLLFMPYKHERLITTGSTLP